MIDVKQSGPGTFEVTVKGRTTTTHRVTVGDDAWKRLTEGRLPPADLVRRSFEFLLEREPNTSILRSFDLPVIGEYFPEYEEKIREGLDG